MADSEEWLSIRDLAGPLLERNLDGIVEEKLSRMSESFSEIMNRCPPPSTVGLDSLSKKIHLDYYF